MSSNPPVLVFSGITQSANDKSLFQKIYIFQISDLGLYIFRWAKIWICWIYGESTEISGLIYKTLEENSETGCSTKLRNQQGHKWTLNEKRSDCSIGLVTRLFCWQCPKLQIQNCRGAKNKNKEKKRKNVWWVTSRKQFS